MQSTSTLYDTILAAPHTVECKVVINNVTYNQDKIISLQTTGSIYEKSTPCIGSCVSREIDLEIINPSVTIPRMAEIKLYKRIVNATQQSEWLPKGTFYIDTRQTDGDVLKIHGYDAILKMEQNYAQSGTVTGWPKPMTTVVSDVCTRLGLTLDSRTVLHPPSTATHTWKRYSLGTGRQSSATPETIYAVNEGGSYFAYFPLSGTYTWRTDHYTVNTNGQQLPAEYSAALGAGYGICVGTNGNIANQAIVYMTGSDTTFTAPNIIQNVYRLIPTKGSYDTEVTSPDAEAYPHNGPYGNYWYEYEGSSGGTMDWYVQFPGYPSGFTVREVMQSIAAANGGNWIMTDAGQLRLVPLKHGASVANLGREMSDFLSAPAFDQWGTLVMLLDSQTYYQSGSSGREMECSCAWGTQAMADYVLTQISGYTYRPYEATEAITNPAIELGDAVTVNSTASLMATQTDYYDALGTCDITAPADEEIDHEYSAKQTSTQEIKRELAQAQAQLSVEAQRISLVVNPNTDTIKAAEIVAAINNSASTVKISADHVNVSGFVTFDNLATQGQTTINGGNITTGTISGNRIEGGTIIGSTLQGGTLNMLAEYTATDPVPRLITSGEMKIHFVMPSGSQPYEFDAFRIYFDDAGSGGSSALRTIIESGGNTQLQTALRIHSVKGLSLEGDSGVWIGWESPSVVIGNSGTGINIAGHNISFQNGYVRYT